MTREKTWIYPIFILMILFLWTSRLGLDGYEAEYLLSARNVIENGSFYMASDPQSVPGVTDRIPGHPVLPRHNLLQVVLTIPFYIAGMPFNHLLTPAESGVMALPMGSLVATSLLNPLFTLLAMGLIYRICLQLNRSRQAAGLCGLIYGIATSAWPATTMGMEPLQTTCMLLSIFCLLNLKTLPSLKNTLALSFSLMALMHTKISAPVIAIPLVIFSIFILIKSRSQNHWKNLFSLLSILTVSTLIWLVLYVIRSQSFYGSSFFARFNLSLIPRNIWGLIFSPGKGIIIYNLIFLWCIWSVRDFAVKHPWVFRLFLSITGLVFLQTACWDWSLIEECWGPRYLLPVVPLVLIAGSGSFEREKLTQHKLLFVLILSLSILVQIPGLLYPNVCLMKYVHSPDSSTIDLTTWTTDLSPIRVGWHMIANQFRYSLGSDMVPYQWHHYEDIVGWGAEPILSTYSDHRWNRPYLTPFLAVRYIYSSPGSSDEDTPDPRWLFITWVFVTGLLLLGLWRWNVNTVP